jgi:hypothetical protein
MIGRVYYLTSAATPLVYVGSTQRTLAERLSVHKANYKRWLRGVGHYLSAWEVVQHADVRIELLDEVPIDSPWGSAREVEDRYIQLLRDNAGATRCVNLHRAQIDDEDRRQWKRSYHQQRVRCSCGQVLARGSLFRHTQTAKHARQLRLLR